MLAVGQVEKQSPFGVEEWGTAFSFSKILENIVVIPSVSTEPGKQLNGKTSQGG